MALQGSLADIGTVDLLQFGQSGRKSGELLLASSTEEAKLYYDHGQLVHATLGSREGLEVIVEILGWSEGQFQFTSGVQTTSRTVHMDLPRALMSALKMRDDRLAASRASNAGQDSTELTVRSELTALVAQFVSSTPNTKYACLFDVNWQTVAESGGVSGDIEDLDRLKVKLRDLVADYPRAGLERLFLTDGNGYVAVSTIPSGGLAMTIANERASLGALSVAISKLAAAVGRVEQRKAAQRAPA
jgi:hypothetical protein